MHARQTVPGEVKPSTCSASRVLSSTSPSPPPPEPDPSRSLAVLLPLARLHHRIYDTDGDFLLIEAAQALPSWVTPSNSENRVRTFVYPDVLLLSRPSTLTLYSFVAPRSGSPTRTSI